MGHEISNGEKSPTVYVCVFSSNCGVFGVFRSADRAYEAIQKQYGDWVKKVDRAAGQVDIVQAPGLFAVSVYVLARQLDKAY